MSSRNASASPDEPSAAETTEDARQAGTWFSRGGTGRAGSVLYYYMGHDREFPADAEIPLDLMRAAAREFLDSAGQRPSCVDWQPHPLTVH